MRVHNYKIIGEHPSASEMLDIKSCNTETILLKRDNSKLTHD